MSKNERLELTGAVTLAQDGSEKGNRFSILAYSGAVVDRAWGKLVIDTEGITARQKLPILLGHDSGAIVGFSTRAYVEAGAFRLSGTLSSSTPEAERVRSLSNEGFPWNCSIGVTPKKVLSIGQGETQTVNGRKVSGPCELWSESEVVECSFVAIGADRGTLAEVFNNGGDNMKSQAKLKWNSDPALQAEFFGDFEAFEAYENAITVGNVKFVQGAPCKTFSREDAIADEPAETMSPAQGDDAWNVDPAIKEEFGDKETYEAFLKAEAGNKFKVLNH